MGRLTTALALMPGLAACGGQTPPAPVLPDVYLAPDTTIARGVVAPGSTLETMLLDQGLETGVVHGVIDAVRMVFDPRRLRSLQPFLLELSLDGALRLSEYEM